MIDIIGLLSQLATQGQQKRIVDPQKSGRSPLMTVRWQGMGRSIGISLPHI